MVSRAGTMCESAAARFDLAMRELVALTRAAGSTSARAAP